MARKGGFVCSTCTCLCNWSPVTCSSVYSQCLCAPCRHSLYQAPASWSTVQNRSQDPRWNPGALQELQLPSCEEIGMRQERKGRERGKWTRYEEEQESTVNTQIVAPVLIITHQIANTQIVKQAM